jgi:hypothetical protein
LAPEPDHQNKNNDQCRGNYESDFQNIHERLFDVDHPRQCSFELTLEEFYRLENPKLFDDNLLLKIRCAGHILVTQNIRVSRAEIHGEDLEAFAHDFISIAVHLQHFVKR